ncbi:conserved hypothetical protein [uncultured Sporomusa sp.]|uniref:Uncharacterized protein n=1 Tax=uncultured Sporomusa sp. TaxID=307249 RepID=A0A212LXZ9_9FIRM|nr:hypothetical protein [uncultured Sporomusa sp.]SCM82402.1 conserved hypothetical protein [uncultured Sporomusa sp.]
MHTKEMLDKAVKIIARQDIDRDLMLFFMNTARRAIIRDKDITKFQQTLFAVPHVSGAIDLAALNIKGVKVVEYDSGMDKRLLTKLENYATARRYYTDFARTGRPEHYFEQGTKLQVLPAPAAGTINLVAEVWPIDLVDSTTSTDVTTTEIPEAWIYLAVAEYFDYFDEGEKGNYWRQKGSVLVEQYIAQLNAQETYGVSNMVHPYFKEEYMRGDY